MASHHRILWFDSLKLFSIFLVLWGHVILFYGSTGGHNDVVCSHIYAFHMPLFMVVSGYFSHRLLSGQGDVRKRFRQLIVPCITFGILCLVLSIGDLNFWFLKCLFYCYVVYYLYFVKLPSFKGKTILFIAVFVLTMPLLEKTPYQYKFDFMFPFFCMGLSLYKYRELMAKHLDWLLWVVFVLSVALMVLWRTDFVCYQTPPCWYDASVLIHEHKVRINSYLLIASAMRYLTGAVCSLFFILLFWRMSDIVPERLQHIGSWGRYTLEIYLLQSFLVEKNFLRLHLPGNMYVADLIVAPIAAMMGVIACVLIAQLLERNKYAAFLLFGKQL